MAAKRNSYEPLRRMSGPVRSLVNAAPIGLRAYLTLAGRLGYLPKYRNPRTFNEKLVWLSRNRVDSRRALLADKLAVKAYVARVAPEARTAQVLTEADRGEDLRTDGLPEVCVLKANNGYGRNRILHAPHDREVIVRQANAWLATDPCVGLFPWESHYRAIPPRVFIEEFLEGEGNAGLADYKVFVLHGSPVLVRVMTDRRKGRFSRAVYGTQWQPLDAVRPPLPWQDANAWVTASDVPRPPLLPVLLNVSRKLAADMPFVSVDAYLVDGEVYVGELTFSPAGGAVPFPYAFDVALGARFDVA